MWVHLVLFVSDCEETLHFYFCLTHIFTFFTSGRYGKVYQFGHIKLVHSSWSMGSFHRKSIFSHIVDYIIVSPFSTDVYRQKTSSSLEFMDKSTVLFWLYTHLNCHIKEAHILAVYVAFDLLGQVSLIHEKNCFSSCKEQSANSVLKSLGVFFWPAICCYMSEHGCR